MYALSNKSSLILAKIRNDKHTTRKYKKAPYISQSQTVRSVYTVYLLIKFQFIQQQILIFSVSFLVVSLNDPNVVIVQLV